MTAVGLGIGLLLGGIVTHLYDRKGFHRIHGAAEMAIAREHQARQRPRADKHAAALATEDQDGTDSPSDQA